MTHLNCKMQQKPYVEENLQHYMHILEKKTENDLHTDLKKQENRTANITQRKQEELKKQSRKH